MPGPPPHFIVIGAQKSGTTTLRLALDQHPRVGCARETHYFCDHHDRGAAWYRARFDELDGDVLGEKCPHYIVHDRALDRIAEECPDVHLLVILRDPVRRARSHHLHQQRRGREPLELAEALDAEQERRSSGEVGYEYVERGMYLRQLQRVVDIFGRDRLDVLVFEELVADSSPTLSPVWRSLGVEPPDGPVVIPRANPHREYRPRWLWNAMHDRRLWRRLPPPLARSLHRAMERDSPVAPIDGDVEQRLAETFDAENAALASWLGRESLPWGVRREPPLGP